MDKTGKMEFVAEHIARLLLLHGLEGITHSKVARASRVSRPWLYKYIGREREDLIRFACKHFGLRMAEFDNRPRTATREQWVEDSIEGFRSTLRLSTEAPWVLPLYFRNVGLRNTIGEYIAEIEARYLETAARELVAALGLDPDRARWQAELLHATRLGIVYRRARVGNDQEVEFELILEQYRLWLATL